VTSNLINVCLEPLYASDELCLLTGTSWFFTSETDARFFFNNSKLAGPSSAGPHPHHRIECFFPA
jgi:hypothetical protein